MKIPRAETMQKFLLSKGWKIEKREERATLLIPPDNLKFERKSFKYLVPNDEIAEDYEEYSLRLAYSIAEVYQMNKRYLLDLLSQTIEEMQQDIAQKTAIVSA